ncbi:MAG TPA: ATP-binding cassette domain-containing protein [Thermoanaerobaculia bacterium]|nr:ATP-binding cassette domain-containing protein [Thermoanaerobaculia bacterium]
MIEAQNLSRRYGDFTAVNDVSFAVGEGEILGLLGPNGAGKTTTIRMITGFLPPTEGRVSIGGTDLFEAPVKARRQIGYLPENVALYGEMRVGEYLSYRAGLEGLKRAEAKRACESALERCLLSDVRNQVIGTLSKGYRQRVGLATAILHDPEVLILDEPTVGLDPKQIIAIRELIRDLGRERTLILSTHILSEVELLCNRVLIIDKGRIVAEGTPASLRQSSRGASEIRVAFLAEGGVSPAGPAPTEITEAAEITEALGALPGVTAVVPGTEAGEFRLTASVDADPRAEIFRLAVAKGWTLVELAQTKASLEDVFVRLTTSRPAEAAETIESDTDEAGEAAEPAEEEAS